MAAVTELDLPQFDYTDQELRGERYRDAMRGLEGDDWIYGGPLGYLVVEREAGEFFLRTKAAQFPGLTIAELFEVRDGPLHREMTGNIINVNGDDHRRLRNLVNPALAPRAAIAIAPRCAASSGADGALPAATGGASSSPRSPSPTPR